MFESRSKFIDLTSLSLEQVRTYCGPCGGAENAGPDKSGLENEGTGRGGGAALFFYFVFVFCPPAQSLQA